MNLFDLIIEKKFEYTGEALPRSYKDCTPEQKEFYEKQKSIRREIHLPITKSLVFYQPPFEKGSIPYTVISFSAKPFVTKDNRKCDWYMVNLQVMGIDNEIRIHGDFFEEMQKPDFIERVNEISEEETDSSEE